MKLKTLEDLFVHELHDIYDAEKQLLRALKKMAKAASSTELRTAFEEHLTQTEGQVERLESVFEEFDSRPRGRTCEAMKGLISEGKDIIDSEADDATGDAGLIASAQKVEHYETAAYGCLAMWASQLGHAHAERLLRQTLDEEKAADQKLTSLAERRINTRADADPDLRDSSGQMPDHNGHAEPTTRREDHPDNHGHSEAEEMVGAGSSETR